MFTRTPGTYLFWIFELLVYLEQNVRTMDTENKVRVVLLTHHLLEKFQNLLWIVAKLSLSSSSSWAKLALFSVSTADVLHNIAYGLHSLFYRITYLRLETHNFIIYIVCSVLAKLNKISWMKIINNYPYIYLSDISVVFKINYKTRLSMNYIWLLQTVISWLISKCENIIERYWLW